MGQVQIKEARGSGGAGTQQPRTRDRDAVPRRRRLRRACWLWFRGPCTSGVRAAREPHGDSARDVARINRSWTRKRREAATWLDGNPLARRALESLLLDQRHCRLLPYCFHLWIRVHCVCHFPSWEGRPFPFVSTGACAAPSVGAPGGALNDRCRPSVGLSIAARSPACGAGMCERAAQDWAMDEAALNALEPLWRGTTTRLRAHAQAWGFDARWPWSIAFSRGAARKHGKLHRWNAATRSRGAINAPG